MKDLLPVFVILAFFILSFIFPYLFFAIFAAVLAWRSARSSGLLSKVGSDGSPH
jgi:hypothetical protein